MKNVSHYTLFCNDSEVAFKIKPIMLEKSISMLNFLLNGIILFLKYKVKLKLACFCSNKIPKAHYNYLHF